MTDSKRPSTIPGETKAEPRESTKGGDQLLTSAVALIVMAGLLAGAGLGIMLALLYKALDPIGVGMPMAIAWGGIVGAVTGGMVAAREIVGRFDLK